MNSTSTAFINLSSYLFQHLLIATLFKLKVVFVKIKNKNKQWEPGFY